MIPLLPEITQCLYVRIDVSSDNFLSLVIADDVSCMSVKAVCGLSTVSRRRWTTEFANASNQGRVAKGLLLDSLRLTSSCIQLNFGEWKLLHRSRLSILPLFYTPGITAPDKRCRADTETTSHVTSHWRVSLPEIWRRHDAILEELANIIRKAGHTVRVNLVFPDTILRPEVVLTSTTPQLIIGVTVPFDAPESLQAGFDRKVAKYWHLDPTLPLVVGALESWLPTNNTLASSLGIRPNAWRRFGRKSRLAAIQGTMKVVSHHLRAADNDEGLDLVSLVS